MDREKTIALLKSLGFESLHHFTDDDGEQAEVWAKGGAWFAVKSSEVKRIKPESFKISMRFATTSPDILQRVIYNSLGKKQPAES